MCAFANFINVIHCFPTPPIGNDGASLGRRANYTPTISHFVLFLLSGIFFSFATSTLIPPASSSHKDHWSSLGSDCPAQQNRLRPLFPLVALHSSDHAMVESPEILCTHYSVCYYDAQENGFPRHKHSIKRVRRRGKQ